MGNQLAVTDKLLVVAQALEESGRRPFTAEDLVVEAWRQFDDTFGLSGYVDDAGKRLYPDSNRVYAEIMGSKPIRKQGLVEKTGRKMYRLTQAGRSRALSLAGVDASAGIKKLSISRDAEVSLRRLFESRAARKHREDNVDDISFFDACGFWGIGARSKAKDLWARFAETDEVLSGAKEALGGGSEGSVRHGGVPYTLSDIEAIEALHHDLQARFAEDLKVIEKRTHDTRRRRK